MVCRKKFTKINQGKILKSHENTSSIYERLVETIRLHQTKEVKQMAKNNNQILVPQARAALDQFKYEAAQEVGVNLKQGYNGDLTSRQAGSIGGQMVKKMIYDYEQRSSGGQAQSLGMTQDLSSIKQQNQSSQF